MKSIVNQESYLQYRINTFKNSSYEKLRNKCAPKKVKLGLSHKKKFPWINIFSNFRWLKLVFI